MLENDVACYDTVGRMHAASGVSERWIFHEINEATARREGNAKRHAPLYAVSFRPLPPTNLLLSVFNAKIFILFFACLKGLVINRLRPDNFSKNLGFVTLKTCQLEMELFNFLILKLFVNWLRNV